MSDIEYKECYVAFLDILGFKDLIKTEAFDKILGIFRALSDDGFKTAFFRAADKKDDMYGKYNDTLMAVNVHVMSDSIVVSAPCDSPYALETLIDVCMFLQIKLFDLDEPVLMRGAVAKGEYYCNDSVVFGRGMVDAYLYQENYSVYPRIILSNDLVREIKYEEHKGKLFMDDEDKYWYIDCMKEYLGNHNESDEECRKFRSLIDKYLNGYADIRIRQKYMWLDEEYDRVVHNVLKGKIGIIVEDN